MKAGDSYTCAHCGGRFETEWSDEDAAAEADENFGGLLGDDPAVICDDCYQAMVGIKPPKVDSGAGPPAADQPRAGETAYEAALLASVKAAHGVPTCDPAGRPLSTYSCSYHEGWIDGYDACERDGLMLMADQPRAEDERSSQERMVDALAAFGWRVIVKLGEWTRIPTDREGSFTPSLDGGWEPNTSYAIQARPAGKGHAWVRVDRDPGPEVTP